MRREPDVLGWRRQVDAHVFVAPLGA